MPIDKFTCLFCEPYKIGDLRYVKKQDGSTQIMYGNGNGTRSVHVRYPVSNPYRYARSVASQLGLPRVDWPF